MARGAVTTVAKARLAARVLALCPLVACAPRGTDAPAPSSASEPEPQAFTAVAAEPPEALPAPYRGRLEAAVALDATCASCHVQEAAEWRGSRHHTAYSNAAFQQALAVEPTGFCRGCHAPESEPARTPARAVSDLGVGCVSCHVAEEGVVLAGPSGTSLAPHQVRRSVAFARTGGCAGCHEFRFPAAHGDEDGDLMQTTLREHDRSHAAGTSCASCHMPLVEGRRSHAFAGTRDAGWLRDRLIATAARVGDRGVRITLEQTTPGHAFPTGDLFRRIEVGCEIVGEGGKVAGRVVRHLARHFVIEAGKPGRTLVRDDRVFDEPKVVEIELPSAGRVKWWVTYQRVATVGAGADPTDARVESAVVLHAGTLP